MRKQAASNWRSSRAPDSNQVLKVEREAARGSQPQPSGLATTMKDGGPTIRLPAASAAPLDLR